MLPDISKKVAVLFTGGVESFLVGKLCIEKYGPENTIFVLYAMDCYNVFFRKPDKVNRITNDFFDSVKRLGGKHTIVIDNDLYNKHDGYLADRTQSIVCDLYKDCEVIFGGYNNLHKECFQIAEDIDFENNQDNASKKARLLLASEPKKYTELYDLIFKCNGVIYFIEDDYTLKNFKDIKSMYDHPMVHAPLFDLKKEEVIDVYRQKDWLEDLYDTRSCNVDDIAGQCGVCKNCLNRKLAFELSGVEDKTKYVHI